MIKPSGILSPTFTFSLESIPSLYARILCSIFMASMTTKISPSLILLFTLLFTEMTFPGSGAASESAKVSFFLHSEKEEFFVPKVGILTYFVKAPFARRVALNRENIFIRDFFTCQYCGKSAESVDHIIPRSKGGLHEWSNVVACCKKCNLIKADKLLHQTHLNLKNPPSNPKDNFWIKTIVGSNPDPSWEEYLISA